MDIQPASIKDIPDILHLINCCYRSETSRKGWTTDADILEGTRASPQMIREEMTKPGSQYFKCVDSSTGQTVGCVYAEFHPQTNTMYTGTLCVQPEIQTNGIGKKLVEAVDDFARSKGCVAVTLKTVSALDKLIRWYERRGFELTGETEPFPDKFGTPKGDFTLELVWMQKLL